MTIQTGNIVAFTDYGSSMTGEVLRVNGSKVVIWINETQMCVQQKSKLQLVK